MCIVVCDGLKGLPDAITAVWDRTIVQTCHSSAPQHVLVRVPRILGRGGTGSTTDLYRCKRGCAREQFDEFTDKWGPRIQRSSGSGRTPRRKSFPGCGAALPPKNCTEQPSVEVVRDITGDSAVPVLTGSLRTCDGLIVEDVLAMTGSWPSDSCRCAARDR